MVKSVNEEKPDTRAKLNPDIQNIKVFSIMHKSMIHKTIKRLSF